MQKQERHIETWLSYVAVVVAILAAGAAIYEARINREHQAISVWPYLQMWAGIQTGDDIAANTRAFEFNIANKGVGPAIVESIKIRYKDEEVRNWYQLSNKILEEANADTALVKTLGEAALEAGEVIEASEVHSVVFSKSEEFARIVGPVLYQHAEVEICYCSLYEECWQLTFPEARPKQPKTCRRRKD